MSNRINRATARELIEENFSSDAKILSEFSTLCGFAAAAASGEPVSLLAGVALITQSAAAAISAGVAVTKRLFKKTESGSDLPQYERFRLLFYITCLRSYIEAVPEAMNELAAQEDALKVSTAKRKELRKVKQKIENQLASLDEAEVNFLFCIEPLHDPVPLFEAFSAWMARTLGYYGFDLVHVRGIVEECTKKAKTRFYTFIARTDQEATWMRNYLAISRTERTVQRIVTDLKSIRQTLDNWSAPASKLKKREEDAWASYRVDLERLPDHKETMYNENFGVRKVFLQPAATYHIAGLSGDEGTPAPVPNLGVLLGALVSNRIPGEDLLILCGGPGCGKSTLCRVFASQLARNDSMHPVFLRLRRLKEGADVGVFIEESMHRFGLITRLSDLRGVNNLIFILDGFDELVMASRSRLRQFFNMLRDEHAAGPLSSAKFLVSGRDTLFPKGEGLPTGSHVVTLLPFDSPRVAMWGKKWRGLHKTGPGATFQPEALLDTQEDGGQPSPLQHLVSWPLTLHLVARVHTAGRLNLAGKKGHEVEKAYLYRSILSETTLRQADRDEGKGHLEPKKLRTFIRALAWEMYSQSTDSMDPSDVVPLLSEFFPDASEADMSELADVAVVNCPELTKGEETGFEFVHKSFSEYLAAEQIAHTVERVIFKAPQFGTDEETWRMTLDESASELAPIIGSRLLTEEVQEMLEPMLGCLAQFLAGDRVDQIVKGESRRDGLYRIVLRFADLVKELLQGRSLDIISREIQNKASLRNHLEAFANQCAGCVIIGTAAARQLNTITDKAHGKRVYFDGMPFRGAFWQMLCLMHAGGLHFDANFSTRIFEGMALSEGTAETSLDDRSIPLRLAHLGLIEGYEQVLTDAVARFLGSVTRIQLRSNLLMLILAYFTGGKRFRLNMGFDFFDFDESWGRKRHRYRDRDSAYLLDVLTEAGLVHPRIFNRHTLDLGGWREFEHRFATVHSEHELLDTLHQFVDYLRHNEPRNREDDITARYLYELLRSIELELSHTRGKRKSKASEK